MKRKALRVRSEGSIPSYVTEAESRKQHSDSPLCNSLKKLCRASLWIAETFGDNRRTLRTVESWFDGHLYYLCTLESAAHTSALSLLEDYS